MPRSATRSGGQRGSRLHDRRVGDDPARRHVTLRGDLVAGQPERADGAPGRGGPGRLCMPDVRRHGSVRGRRARSMQVLRTPGRPTRPCRPPRAARPAVAELHQHLDVERGVLQPRTAAADASTSRRRSAPCASAARTAPRRAWRGRPGGSRAAGRPARCRTAPSVSARPRARHGRSWLAACRIHSVPASASMSGVRSSKAIGSTSAGRRRPHGAAGSGRRGPSSGSRRHARRRSRPDRCRRRGPRDRRELLGGDDHVGQPVAQRRAGGPGLVPARLRRRVLGAVGVLGVRLSGRTGGRGSVVGQSSSPARSPR